MIAKTMRVRAIKIGVTEQSNLSKILSMVIMKDGLSRVKQSKLPPKW